jgi:hypothetical protein
MKPKRDEVLKAIRGLLSMKPQPQSAAEVNKVLDKHHPILHDATLLDVASVLTFGDLLELSMEAEKT